MQALGQSKCENTVDKGIPSDEVTALKSAFFMSKAAQGVSMAAETQLRNGINVALPSLLPGFSKPAPLSFPLDCKAVEEVGSDMEAKLNAALEREQAAMLDWNAEV